MKILKKLTVFLTIIAMVASMCVTASADTEYDKLTNYGRLSPTRTVKSGKTYTDVVVKAYDANSSGVMYKFKASKAGKLTIKVTSSLVEMRVIAFDAKKNTIYPCASSGIKTQTLAKGNNHYTTARTSSSPLSFSLTYNVRKGTNYIFLLPNSIRSTKDFSATSKISFSSGSGSSSGSSSSSANATITNLTLTLKKGSSIQLGADLSRKVSQKVKWNSSMPSVAPVDAAGRVKAKAKGSAIITATMGKSIVKIKINVV